MILTPHFTKEEFEQSETAIRMGVDNTVPESLMPNLQRLAALLEKVRTLVGPILITSGYRCQQVNLATGGALNSAHMQARAADIHVSGIAHRDLARYISGSAIKFDKLILEFDAWCHIQVETDGEAPRNQVLTAKHSPHGTLYVPGLVL